jgi:hypothetical protein
MNEEGFCTSHFAASTSHEIRVKPNKQEKNKPLQTSPTQIVEMSIISTFNTTA